MSTDDPATPLALEPRREAGVFGHDELTHKQEVALDRARTLVEAMAREPAPVDGKGIDRAHATTSGLGLFLPKLDRRRTNHVVLFDGPRGSGKTSVMLTLLDDWAEKWRNGAPNPAIVPTQPIDLQPLPPASSLVLHIAGRFERIVEALEEATAGVDTSRSELQRRNAPWDSHELRSRSAWRRFVRAVGGWERGFERGPGTLDPEAFAVELEQAERERLDLHTAFAAFLDALEKDFRSWQHLSSPPLFVLALDDADMNPMRTVELVDLVRTLWHPRLAFLVTGDSDLFLVTLRAHHFGALRRPTAGLALVNPERDRLEDRDQPARLAGEVYDKAFPREQRLDLRDLTPSERMAFPRFRPATGGTRKTIRELLHAIDIPLDRQHAIPLDEYFDDLLRQSPLTGSLRALENLHGALVERLRHSTPLPEDRLARAVRVAGYLWNRALENADLGALLHPEHIRRLRDVVRVDPDGGYIRVDRSALVPLAEERALITFQGGLGALKDRLVLNSIKRYRVRLRDELLLPEELAAAFMLVADLAARARSDPANEGLWGALGYLNVPFGVASVYLSETDGEVRFTWPVPSWDTVLDNAMLSRALDAFFAKNSGASDFVGAATWLAQLFLRAVTFTVKEQRVPNSSDLHAVPLGSRDAWPLLAEAVVDLQTPDPSTATNRAWAISSWAAETGLLGSPLAGLPNSVCDEWLRCLAHRFGKDWPYRAQSLQLALRGRLIAARSKRRPEDLLELLRAKNPDHPWFRWTELHDGPVGPATGPFKERQSKSGAGRLRKRTVI